MLQSHPHLSGFSQGEGVEERHPVDAVRFGPYEVRLLTQEVFKGEMRLKLPPKAFQVLRLLLEANGQLVTREEFHRALWAANTFVDFEHGLNNAVKKLRDVLNDSPEIPRYIETLPRLGYRFIGKETEPARMVEPAVPEPQQRSQFSRRTAAWAIVAVVCVAAAFAGGTLRHRAEIVPLTPVPFTAFPGLEVSPTFSPDGSQIAFAWSGDLGHSQSIAFDLYTKVIGSEETLRLTTQPSEWISPAWSPDGRQIAFHRISGEGTGLYLISALGGPEKRIKATKAVESNAQISWSPDGKYIAYADSLTPNDESRIFLLSPETLESRQIPHVDECQEEFRPAFSSGSNLLAYACYLRSGGFGLYSMVVPEGYPQLIKTLSGYLLGVAWTGDGRRLVISRHEDGKPDELLEVNASDGSFEKLPFGGNGSLPAVSLKGDKLAYAASGDSNIAIWRAGLADLNSAPVRFISSTYNDETPQYSPDGKHIAFSSSRGGNSEIWISDERGMHPMQVSHLGNPSTGLPVWSPDGKQIAFDSRKGGHANIYVADLGEMLPHKLKTDLNDIAHPWWSRDGKWIYFLGGTDDTLGERIYRCPASGGEAVPVSISRGLVPEEAPDGTAVYFASNVGGFWKLVRASLHDPSSESVVQEVPPLRFVGDWTLVKGGIYFIPASSPRTIHYVNFANGKITSLFTADKPFFVGLSASPDQRWLLFTQIEAPGSDIMLVEHFH